MVWGKRDRKGMNLEVGDVVRVSNPTNSMLKEFYLGALGIISKIAKRKNYPIEVRFPDGANYAFNEKELEFIE